MNWTLEVGDVACPVDAMNTTDYSRFLLGFYFIFYSYLFREDGQAERRGNRDLRR